jgi:hypothetical protein
MKKIINMKKVIVAATIFTTVLFVFPLSSFAQGEDDSDSCVLHNTGNIEGLVFNFGDGFYLVLGPEFAATITDVEVIASGQELTVVTPESKHTANYIYNATLTGGWNGSKKGKGKNKGKIIADAIIYVPDGEGDYVPTDVLLHFEFDSASLFEQFKIKIDKDDIDAVCYPDISPEPNEESEADLFFEVIKNKLIGITWWPDDDDIFQKTKSDSFNFILILEDGDVDVSQTF